MDVKTYPVTHTEAEWRKIVTPSNTTSCASTAPSGREAARSTSKSAPAPFTCAGCDQELFTGRRKFESGTGWPSFNDPVARLDRDDNRQKLRHEPAPKCIAAAAADHLGHVFDDGPPPTGPALLHQRRGDEFQAGITADPLKAMSALKRNKPSAPRGAAIPRSRRATATRRVQAYIAAMPGWKSNIGRRLDALIVRIPSVCGRRSKYNSPLYGAENQDGTWFLGIHVFTKYMKVAFFRGARRCAFPPGTSKQKDVRYLDIHEDDELDEAQIAALGKQASELPGEKM